MEIEEVRAIAKAEIRSFATNPLAWIAAYDAPPVPQPILPTLFIY